MDETKKPRGLIAAVIVLSSVLVAMVAIIVIANIANARKASAAQPILTDASNDIPQPSPDFRFGWKRIADQSFEMRPTQAKKIWEVAQPADRSANSLIRISVRSIFPIHLGFVQGGASNVSIDPDLFDKDDDMLCVHTDVTLLTTNCKLTWETAKRVLVIQDAHAATLTLGDAGKKALNRVAISVEYYDCVRDCEGQR